MSHIKLMPKVDGSSALKETPPARDGFEPGDIAQAIVLQRAENGWFLNFTYPDGDERGLIFAVHETQRILAEIARRM